MDKGPHSESEPSASDSDETTKSITIVSTHTIDVVPVEHANETREIPGGPARYIADALNRLHCPFRVITGEKVRVTVVPGPGGEEYIIPPIPLIPLPTCIEDRAIILSPVMGEIDPGLVPPTSGMLVVDLQGFVRDADVPSGHVRRTFDVTSLLRRADVVKATDGEIQNLSVESRDALQDRILVITRGKKGAIVRDQGQEYTIQGETLPVKNTIGAGDIFLAGFVFGMISGNSPHASGRQALQFTEGILRERLKADAG